MIIPFTELPGDDQSPRPLLDVAISDADRYTNGHTEPVAFGHSYRDPDGHTQPFAVALRHAEWHTEPEPITR